MNANTERLLAELAAPSIIDIATAKTELLDALDVLRKLDQQAAEYEALSRRAELEEEDQAVRGKLPALQQAWAAIMRVNREIGQRVNELVVLLSDQIPAELNGIAEEREIPDPDATVKVKADVIEALDELAEIEAATGNGAKAEKARAALEAVEPMLAKGVRVKARVRTDGLRQVAERAGYSPWPKR